MDLDKFQFWTLFYIEDSELRLRKAFQTLGSLPVGEKGGCGAAVQMTESAGTAQGVVEAKLLGGVR